jgi:hypothetical protein
MDAKEGKKNDNGGERATATPPVPPAAQGTPTARVAAKGTQPGSTVYDAEVDFAPTYPVLVEPMAPQGAGGAMTSGRGFASGTDVGAQVANTLRDVLGWQPRANDPKGFVGALTQSFDLYELEGHTEAKWRERRFAVQSDLAGGISGAQASLLTRARHAVDEALPMLEALYDLTGDADPQRVEAFRAIVRSQLDELVNELATMGGPRVMRVDQLFELLLGPGEYDASHDEDGLAGTPITDPDDVTGRLGELRDELGLDSDGADVNTVDEEQNVTNYRVLADYVVGLRRSWEDNRGHFSRSREGTRPAKFLGTQLVLLSRQLAVVAESVGELRTVLDSVFIGALERQTLEIVPWAAQHFFSKPSRVVLGMAELDKRAKELALTDDEEDKEEPFFLEELLGWIESFATREGPQLIESAGRLGVVEAFLPTVQILRQKVTAARCPSNRHELPDGYFTARARRAFHELEGHLYALERQARPNAPSSSTSKRAPAADAGK